VVRRGGQTSSSSTLLTLGCGATALINQAQPLLCCLVRDRQALVSTLRGLLNDLGLSDGPSRA